MVKKHQDKPQVKREASGNAQSHCQDEYEKSLMYLKVARQEHNQPQHRQYDHGDYGDNGGHLDGLRLTIFGRYALARFDLKQRILDSKAN